ncbi:MAG: Na+/H+ antiporter subunit E [Clostridiales bacterium]|nr:Na+/H+ antiporter subunit E [Clostridiales bacterium]
MNKFITTFLVIFIPWILLTGLNIMEIALGGIVSIIISVIISKQLDYGMNVYSIPKVFKFLFIYIPVFIVELIKANLDVAIRVLNPKLPINPGFVKIPTNIKSDYGRLTLANSITLTPGTLSIDVDDQFVYIHWIDVKGNSPEEYQANVSSSFEKLLGGIFK